MKKEELLELIKNTFPEDIEFSEEEVTVLMRNFLERRRLEIFLKVQNMVTRMTYFELPQIGDFSIFIGDKTISIEFHDEINYPLVDKISERLTSFQTEGVSILIKEVSTRIIKWEVI